MKNKGILTSRREGQTIYYRIVENELMKDCRLVKKAHQQMETSREEN
jgi:DNA-binding transcriptional ArsR family regulator